VGLFDTIQTLKEREEDFEFYPTTPEIISAVKRSVGHIHSMLDCGAGDGRVLLAMNAYMMFAIEKSTTLIQKMPPEIYIVGADFWDNTLIDKNVDLVFSNPPYKEYVPWSEKVIREANARKVVLVIPSRWKESKEIMNAIELRGFSHRVIGTFDFLSADRKSRAKVDVVKLWDPDDDSPFTTWIEQEFGLDQKNTDKTEDTKPISERVNELVKGRGLVSVLVELYRNEMNEVLDAYKAIASIDPRLLNEVGVSRNTIIESIRDKIRGMKNKYWEEVFDRLDVITRRFTAKSRKSFLDSLSSHVNVDFNESNVYSVVIWAIKNVNKYVDKQLVEVFESLSKKANIVNYKSNQKTWGDDEWRFNSMMRNGEVTHYALDYRCIITLWELFSGWSYVTINGMKKSGHDFLNDIITVAWNLGFVCPSWERSDAYNRKWEPGKLQTFYMDRDDDSILMTVRAYKNGNMHIKFNKEFLRALNIEFGRLKGWLRNPKAAADELGIKLKDAEKYFNTNKKLDVSDRHLLLGS